VLFGLAAIMIARGAVKFWPLNTMFRRNSWSSLGQIPTWISGPLHGGTLENT